MYVNVTFRYIKLWYLVYNSPNPEIPITNSIMYIPDDFTSACSNYKANLNAHCHKVNNENTN